MDGVKPCVQRSDTKNMAQFLNEVSDTRENEASRHFAISLYGELAQMHKQVIIPYIPRMMASIVRSLPFSADSHQLHEACAKAVSSVARYTIDPTRPYESNQQILSNLCSPLVPVVASKVQSSAAGAAKCLQALVESEKWKFAHPDLQHLICSKVSAALSERGAHMVPFLHLVKSLAKFSRDASRAHLAEWVRLGLQILQADWGQPVSWQERVVAAQVIAVILKTADVEKLGTDLHAISKVLEAYLTDKVPGVQTAVAEALETIKGLSLEKRMHHDSAGSGCESKRRNSDAEESELQELSGSPSPRSDTSSHEAVPSMASAKVKFGIGPMSLNKQARDSLCLRSHKSLNLSGPSRRKESTPAATPRRVISEIPVPGRLLSNLVVLPSLCQSELSCRSSVDLGNNVSNSLMQDKGLLGSEKSLQSMHNQILDCAKETSSLLEKNAEDCVNLSNAGCTCSLIKEEDRSNNQLASTDQLSGKANSDGLDGSAQEGTHRVPIDSSCRRQCVDDRCAADVPFSCCTGDLLSEAAASKGGLTERSTAVETGRPLQVEKPHAVEEGFPFRAPCSLLDSLQSSGSTDREGKSCKKGTDSDLRSPSKASRRGSDVLHPSSESEESRSAANDYESRVETSGVSCCGLEDAGSSEDRIFKAGSHTYRGSLHKTDHRGGECELVELNSCEIHASGYDWSSSRGTSDSGFGKVGNRQKANLRRSSKKSGRQKGFSAQRREGYLELSAGPDGKSAGIDLSGKEVVLSEVLKRHICAKAALGIICAVVVLVLAVMIIRQISQIYESHPLVPT